MIDVRIRNRIVNVTAVAIAVLMTFSTAAGICYAETTDGAEPEKENTTYTVQREIQSADSEVVGLAEDAESERGEGEAIQPEVPKQIGNPTVTVSIPLKYIIDNERYLKKNVSTTFTLTSGSENTPMPDNRVGGTKSITLNRGGTIDFGNISYTTPDVYKYKITRSYNGIKNLTEDTSTFDVTVYALSTGEGIVIAQRSGEAEKSELTYRDVYKAPSIIKTGDDSNLLNYLTLIMITAILMILIAMYRIQERRFRLLEEEANSLR